jgi:hypothetical protein
MSTSKKYRRFFDFLCNFSKTLVFFDYKRIREIFVKLGLINQKLLILLNFSVYPENRGGAAGE